MHKLENDESFSFLPPWAAVRDHADNLVKELYKELTAWHPLYSMKARAIAQRMDTDDVLFEVDSPDFRYAVVHLSWSDVPEHDSRWPTTEVFDTFQHWIDGRMMPDNQQSTHAP